MSAEVLPTPGGSAGELSTDGGEPRHGGGRNRRFGESRMVFAVTAVGYLGAAWWFWHQHLIPGDAISRLANAYYVLFSRDPHLGAMGFVWNPLPSLILLPVLPLKALVPALTHDGLLAPLSSALFMAGTVGVGNDALRRLPVARTPRLALTLLLAVHPMTLIYAGNGMSEAFFLFFLILTVRGLLQWLNDGRPESLVPVGLSLGMAYGARYEALAPGLAVPVLVAAMSWWRGRDRGRWRWATARADAILVGLPVVASFAGWAVGGKLIVGQWFATFSSAYGNSAQVRANAGGIGSVTGTSLGEKVTYGLQQTFGLEPSVLVLLVLAGVVALRRRDPRVFAPLAVLGSVLAFSDFAFLTGNSFGWLRFQIVAVPLAILLAGFLLAIPGTRASRAQLVVRPRHFTRMPIRIMRRATVAAAVAVVAVVAVAVPAAVITLATPTLAREESEWFTDAGAARTSGLARLNAQIASDLDAMELPEGSVITDAAYAFPIIIASSKPRQFVITSDRDFVAALNDPRGHKVRYLLISATGAADAVRQAYPDADRPKAGNRSVHTWADQWGKVLWTLTPVTW
jgi:hypothetical protein